MVYIPTDIQRAVRQRCAYGCVICGLPLTHYDHMVPTEDGGPNVAENITLLCGRHHDEKSRGILPVEAVQRADTDPVNRRQGRSSPLRLYPGDIAPTVRVGNARFTNSGAPRNCLLPFVIYRLCPIAFYVEDDQLLLSFSAMDRDGNEIARVRKNDIQVTTAPWDITFTGGRDGAHIRVMEHPDSVALDLRLDCTRNIAVIERYRYTRFGIQLWAGPDFLQFVCPDFEIEEVAFVKEKLDDPETSVDALIGILIGSRPTNCKAGILMKKSGGLIFQPYESNYDGEDADPEEARQARAAARRRAAKL